MQEEASEEVGILRTEVAQLQTQLANTTEQLEAANAAAEAERLAPHPPLLPLTLRPTQAGAWPDGQRHGKAGDRAC